MTDSSQAEQAAVAGQTNGFADDGLDDEERGKMRPADIDAVRISYQISTQYLRRLQRMY